MESQSHRGNKGGLCLAVALNFDLFGSGHGPSDYANSPGLKGLVTQHHKLSGLEGERGGVSAAFVVAEPDFENVWNKPLYDRVPNCPR